MNDVAERIKLIRKQNKLTQKQLADYLNVSKTTVGHWENGRRRLQEGDVEAFSKVLNLNPNYLINPIENEKVSECLNGGLEYYLRNELICLKNTVTTLEKTPLYHIEQEFYTKLFLVTCHYRTGEYEKAIELESSFLNFYYEAEVKKESSDFETCLKLCYLIEKFNYEGKYSSGEKMSVELSSLLKDKKQILINKIRTISFIMKQQRYEDGYEKLFHLKGRVEEFNDEKISCDFGIYWAISHRRLNLHKKAISIFSEIEKIALSNDDKELLLLIYQNKGVMSSQLGNYEEALSYHIKAYEMAVSSKSRGGTLRSLIVTSLRLNQFDEADKYISQSDSFPLIKEDKMAIQSYKAELALYKGDKFSSEYYLSDSYDYFVSKKDIRMLKYIYNFLAKYHARQKNFKNATEYFMKLEELQL
ncbi:MAG: helix-turn-helix transcriptional regulator [Turicibacter sp.]|nr:helix-turn-helix transcriptional regulator [Turicibacter sp.]